MSEPELPERIDITIRPRSQDEFVTIYCEIFEEPKSYSRSFVDEHLELEIETITEGSDFQVDETLY